MYNWMIFDQDVKIILPGNELISNLFTLSCGETQRTFFVFKRFMKKKELENSPAAIKSKDPENDLNECANGVTSMVDIIVRIKDDDTFGKLDLIV